MALDLVKPFPRPLLKALPLRFLSLALLFYQGHVDLRLYRKAYTSTPGERVVELRLAGLTAPKIADELRKEPDFEDIKEKDVWNDFEWLNTYAEEEQVVSEVMVKDIYQRVNESNKVLSKKAHLRFKKISNQITSIESEIEEVSEQLSDESLASDDKSSLTSRRDDLRKQLLSFQDQEMRRTQLILQIDDSLTDMPKRLGYVLEKHAVEVTDANEQKLLKALEDAKDDPEEQKRLLHTLRTVRRILE